ncbi:hypothetical protein JB92DRAFT_2864827, partial [Gautieria morchelliformis]
MTALPSCWPRSSSAHDLYHLHQASLAPDMVGHLIVSTTLLSPTLATGERLKENRVLPTGNAGETSPSTSQCPPFHPRGTFTMCITVVGGETKYLGCGCISRPYTTDEDCLSSRCLKSHSHAWNCTHGYQANCRACVHAGAACARHHSCRAHDGYQQRFTACSDHRR